MEGIVFSIEEFSIYDGPGIRTTVFLKGCPLRCSWCHNPEGQDPFPEVIKSPNGCLRCGECKKYAFMEREQVRYTQESILACPNHLLRTAGECISVEKLVERLLKNKNILQKGGVTFSGGEPLMQSDFLTECLSLLKGKLHTAVQTSGYCEPEIFRKVLELTDFFLFDLKLIDENLHRRYTGVSNRKILENFKQLTKSGKQFVPRIPLIPGVTDTEANITQIATLLKENNILYAELMSYNKMAGGKYAMVGRKFTPDFDDAAAYNARQELFELFGIQTKIL